MLCDLLPHCSLNTVNSALGSCLVLPYYMHAVSKEKALFSCGLFFYLARQELPSHFLSLKSIPYTLQMGLLMLTKDM